MILKKHQNKNYIELQTYIYAEWTFLHCVKGMSEKVKGMSEKVKGISEKVKGISENIATGETSPASLLFTFLAILTSLNFITW